MASNAASGHDRRVTELLAPPSTTADLRARSLIPGAVLHLANDQPMLIDLFGLPSPTDPVLVCTNLRSLTGTRPIWADHTHSVFYFPWIHVRFLEIPPTADEIRAPVPGLPALPAPAPETAPGVDLDGDFEIDEEFLRRVRDA
jgi:hypothetical protein